MVITAKVSKPQADHQRPLDYHAKTTETSGNAVFFLLPFTAVSYLIMDQEELPDTTHFPYSRCIHCI